MLSIIHSILSNKHIVYQTQCVLENVIQWNLENISLPYLAGPISPTKLPLSKLLQHRYRRTIVSIPVFTSLECWESGRRVVRRRIGGWRGLMLLWENVEFHREYCARLQERSFGRRLSVGWEGSIREYGMLDRGRGRVCRLGVWGKTAPTPVYRPGYTLSRRSLSLSQISLLTCAPSPGPLFLSMLSSCCNKRPFFPCHIEWCWGRGDMLCIRISAFSRTETSS